MDRVTVALAASWRISPTNLGIRAIEHQALLARVADAQVSLYALAAVLLRADAESRAHGDDWPAGFGVLVDYTRTVLERCIDASLDRATHSAEESLADRLSAQEYERVRAAGLP